MDERGWLAARFEANRAHLRAVAYRMLGSQAEAEDAVQESWLRLSRADSGDVENIRGWLTTIVARVCLDMLRSRKARREEPPFLAASRSGDFDGLLALLDPGVVMHADGAAVEAGAAAEVAGAAAVAGTFAGRARAARPALLAGVPGLAWAHRGVARMAFGFTIADDKITRIDVADPYHLRELDVVFTGS
jgi:RNA polymerase sigma factor (sigma-70 family)